jgi:hypothetical protein
MLLFQFIRLYVYLGEGNTGMGKRFRAGNIKYYFIN